MSTLGTLATPWMLMIDANGAVSPGNDSVAVVTSAGLGTDSFLFIVLVAALIGGVAAMVAGDRRRRAEGRE